MCFSLPRLAATIGLGVLGGEGLSSRGAGGEHWESSGWSDSSETTESTLDESAGMSFFFGLGLGSLIAGVVDFRGWVSQHMVSRPHIRQLRFSSLRPSSTVSAHLEKTGEIVCILHNGMLWGSLTTPHAVKILHIPRVNIAHLPRVHRQHWNF